MKKEKPFKLEADLCSAFIAALPKEWTAYAETAGWDILLVRKEDGCQIGVQAKLKLNADVVTQAISHFGNWWDTRGPDFRAVLVPPGEAGSMNTICAYLGLTVLSLDQDMLNRARSDEAASKWNIRPHLPLLHPKNPHYGHDEQRWHEWWSEMRCVVPDYVPDVPAGVASPVTLSQWKIKAIKIAIIMEKRGFLTIGDFKHIHLDRRRWMPSAGQWLIIDKDAGVYRRGPTFPTFKNVHPKNYAEIEADFEHWGPPEPILKPKQPTLALEGGA